MSEPLLNRDEQREFGRLMGEAITKLDLRNENTALREQLGEAREAVDHWFRLHTRVSADNVELLNRLAQVEKERDDLRGELERKNYATTFSDRHVGED